MPAENTPSLAVGQGGFCLSDRPFVVGGRYG